MSYSMWDANSDGKSIEDLAVELIALLRRRQVEMDETPDSELAYLPMFSDTEKAIADTIDALYGCAKGALDRIYEEHWR